MTGLVPIHRASSYVMTRVLTEIPATAVASFLFSGILYHLVGLTATREAFLFFVFLFFLNLLIASMLGMALGALLPGEATPSVILPLYTTLNMLCAGFFVRKDTIKAMWEWMYYISYMQWGFSASMLNQFQDQSYTAYCEEGAVLPALPGLPEAWKDLPAQLRNESSDIRMYMDLFGIDSTNLTRCQPIQGNDILSMFSLGNRNKWEDVTYAACTYPILIFLCYIGVRFVNHEKR
ncbi:hypothetical protein CYMTET_49679 [Cymbomonas tetramitiformis]|uniref:ABC-2 type transporter transmembrane domain-containing protein n=1 Tax=Cymbomonas tetramitiformis TaxID=36881 RepID=A0AAE0BPT0_9CHLO|nr:hypothetical protein CYMTET_49679 [Cymbomonas tetramitiformis]